MRRREKAAAGLLLAGMVLLSCAEIWACVAGLGALALGAWVLNGKEGKRINIRKGSGRASGAAAMGMLRQGRDCTRRKAI